MNPLSLQGMCKGRTIQRNLNKPCGIYAKAETKANTSKSKQQFLKLSFECLILKGPHFNKELQTECPKLETFRIVHLKPRSLFHMLQPAQAEDVAL